METANKAPAARTTGEWVARIGIALVALVYAAALIKIVLLKNGVASDLGGLQLTPFAFLADFSAQGVDTSVALKNVLGNFAIFIPLGILLPLLFGRLSFPKTVLAGFLVSLCFEIVQLCSGMGLADVDDLILNTLGALAGAGVWFGLLRRIKTPLYARFTALAVLVVFGCCGAVAVLTYHPALLPAQVAYENTEVFGEAERDSYTFSAVSVGLDGNSVTLRKDSVEAAKLETKRELSEQYALSSDVKLITERRSFEYTPNGNIRKTTVHYAEATPEEAAQAIAADGSFADIWLNDSGECSMLVLTVFEK